MLHDALGLELKAKLVRVLIEVALLFEVREYGVLGGKATLECVVAHGRSLGAALFSVPVVCFDLLVRCHCVVPFLCRA